jgi:hypothetical protein
VVCVPGDYNGEGGVTTLDAISTRSLTLINDNGPVVTLGLGTNNVKPLNSQVARLQMNWHGNYPAEIEIEPGPECLQPEGSSIIGEVMMWGKRTPDGKNRGRVTLQINVDSAGGQYALLDSSTNDPSLSEGQSKAMPLLINVGEGRGIYIGLYPSDNSLLIQNRLTGKEVRVPIDKLMAIL